MRPPLPHTRCSAAAVRERGWRRSPAGVPPPAQPAQHESSSSVVGWRHWEPFQSHFRHSSGSFWKYVRWGRPQMEGTSEGNTRNIQSHDCKIGPRICRACPAARSLHVPPPPDTSATPPRTLTRQSTQSVLPTPLTRTLPHRHLPPHLLLCTSLPPARLFFFHFQLTTFCTLTATGLPSSR